jgi:hypothetical protein
VSGCQAAAVPDPVSLLRTAYGDVSAVLSSLTVEEGWEPTGCAGWTAVDLGFHLLSDARRAVVALNTPADGPADTTAVHHLDLVVRLDRPGPAAEPLAEVRRVLAGLLGAPLPTSWDDVTAARRSTGREELTAEDRAALGSRAAAFPLFG